MTLKTGTMADKIAHPVMTAETERPYWTAREPLSRRIEREHAEDYRTIHKQAERKVFGKRGI